jgi:hypothetical protein
MKLPVVEILVEAFRFPWQHRREFARGLIVPLSGLVTLLIAGQYWQPESFPAFAYAVFGILYLLLFCWLAVGCHRLVLLKPDARSTDMKWSRRESYFLIWLIGLLFLRWIVTMVVVMIGVPLLNLLQPPGEMGHWFAQAAELPAWYVFARLSLVFPALALDHRTGLAHAWTLSSGNGIRMFFLVCLFPWALESAFDLLLPQGDSVLLDVIYGVALPLLYVCEICALSLAYRFFTRTVG